jgi:hypothetical protein
MLPKTKKLGASAIIAVIGLVIFSMIGLSNNNNLIADTFQYLEDSSIAVAIFSPSLLSTNWYDYIKETRMV